MKRPKRHSRQRRHRASGFSLIEMMSVVAIGIAVTAIAGMSLMPMLKQEHVTNAYNTTLGALRQARDNALSERTSYTVTFVTSLSPVTNTITVAPTLTTFQGANSSVTYTLPSDMSFTTQTGYPTPGPDSFGTGTNAIDFGYTENSSTGGQTVIYFCPDGSAQSAACGLGDYANNWDNGVVYIARTGDILSSRAVTLWGGTGRIRGWRLYPSGSNYIWKRQ